MSLSVESALRRCVPRPLATVVLIAAGLGVSGCSVWQRAPAPAPMPTPAVVVPTPPVITATPSAPPAPVEVATPADMASRRALANHEQLRSLPPNELAQEIARLSALPPTPDTAIDLAMALLLTRNGGEQLRAIGLVEPLAKGTMPEAEAWQPIARLLLARLQELRRLEDLLERRNQELRDSQRDVKQLNEKLEALKAIERSLAPRPISSVAPGTAGSNSPAAVGEAFPLPRAKAVPRKAPS
ncbi:MAG: DUF3450 domain-containing protein [Burkholderiaceae bacterium]|nr:DUF3450 domain-containing protein [Burkholderiaceae bacterium]